MKINIGNFLKKVADDNEEELEKAGRSIGFLQYMNERGYNMYAGTVSYAEIERRRQRNKMARKSRRINRVK